MNRPTSYTPEERFIQPATEVLSSPRIASLTRNGCAAAMIGLALSACGKKTDETSVAPIASASANVMASTVPAPQASEVPKQRPYLFEKLTPDSSKLTDSDYGSAGLGGPVPKVTPSSTCPPSMVNVNGRFCIDRYEASIYDSAQGRRVSIFYHPNQYHTSEEYNFWTHDPKAHKSLFDIAIPLPPQWQLNEDFHIVAVSQKNRKPNGYLNLSRSEEACRNAGKRLCSETEWVFACRGEANQDFPYGNEYQVDQCNVFRNAHPSLLLHGDSTHYHTDPRLLMLKENGRPFLEKNGQRKACMSKWGNDGIYDMVGNLDEWVDDPNGTFLGGFFSRGTKQGCRASVASHPPSYYDYSLGTRCCLDLKQ